MTHRQHHLNSAAQRHELEQRISRRAQAGAEFLVALAIGVGLAAALVAWWSE